MTGINLCKTVLTCTQIESLEFVAKVSTIGVAVLDLQNWELLQWKSLMMEQIQCIVFTFWFDTEKALYQVILGLL